MRNNDMNLTAGLGALITLAVVGLGFLGYTMNIFSLCAHHDVINALFILRLVGIFAAPLGAVLGYF